MALIGRDSSPLLVAVLTYVSTVQAFVAAQWPILLGALAGLVASAGTALVTQVVLDAYSDRRSRLESRAAFAVTDGAVPVMHSLEAAKSLDGRLSTDLYLDFAQERPSKFGRFPGLPVDDSWEDLVALDKRARAAAHQYSEARDAFAAMHEDARHHVGETLETVINAQPKGRKSFETLLDSIIISMILHEAAGLRESRKPQLPHLRQTIPGRVELEWGSSRPVDGEPAPVQVLVEAIHKLIESPETRHRLGTLADKKIHVEHARQALVRELRLIQAEGKPRNLPFWPRRDAIDAIRVPVHVDVPVQAPLANDVRSPTESSRPAKETRQS